MAVTLTLDDLRAYVESGPTEDGTTADAAYLPGWLSAAALMVERYAPRAPDVLHNRAAQMVIGYWWASHDNPAVIRDHHVEFSDVWTDPKRAADALRFSGAMALLSPYRRRRALGGDPATATRPASTATERTPAGGLPADEVRRLIAEAIAALPPVDFPELPTVPDVSPWALAGNPDLIPGAKVPPVDVPELPDIAPWALAGDPTLIPGTKLPAPPVLPAVPDVAPWALTGDSTLIPTTKLPPVEVPGRSVLFTDSVNYSRSNGSSVFRFVTLARAPMRGRGLLITLVRQGATRVVYPLNVGAADDWLDLPALTNVQTTRLISQNSVSAANCIAVKTPHFAEDDTDDFGHGTVFVGRVNDTRLGFAFAENRGVGASWRMTIREVP